MEKIRKLKLKLSIFRSHRKKETFSSIVLLRVKESLDEVIHRINDRFGPFPNPGPCDGALDIVDHLAGGLSQERVVLKLHGRG